MFKFSKQFFILFILVTVLPIFLMICWSIYSINNIHENHINMVFEIQEQMTRFSYKNYLKNEIKKKTQIINTLKNYQLSLKEYKTILDADKIWWIKDIDKINKLIPSFKITNENKISANYEVIFDKKTLKHQLVSVMTLPLKNNPNLGLVLIKRVPIEDLTHHRPPTTIRITAGNKVDPSKLLFFGFKPKGVKPFEDKMHDKFKKIGPKPPPPPPKDAELKGIIVPIKNSEQNTIANIEIGMPDNHKKFRLFHNPMFSLAFENMYLLGLLIPLLGLILSFIAGSYLKKNFLNPIEDLSKVSEEFSNGNLKTRVCSHVKQPDLNKTILNFNNMLDSIQEKEELKENFITNLTHDFRTPLIAENRTLEILINEKNKPNEQEQIDLLKSLLKNNEHLLEMVNMLLKTYKFESGMLTLKKEPIHLKPLIENCFEQLKPLQEEKGILFELDYPSDIPEINADSSLIKRCFLNLITNAIENIPKKSTIKVSCWIDNKNLKISIEDNGPGIPEEVTKHLFDRYYAGKRTERKIGSGLGLYICKQFIEAHGGTIKVDSVPNEYSDFIITIPIK